MTTTLPTNVTSQYNLGPVKSWVVNAGNLLGQMFGIKTEYGWRQSDPFPDHPSGHAVDFMINSQQQGDALAQYVVNNRGPLGVKYVIWNRQYYGPENGYRPVPYTATSNPHTDHVHVTFLDQPGAWTSSPGAAADATNAGSATLTSASENCAWSLNWPSFSLGPVNASGSSCLLTKKVACQFTGAAVFAAGALLVTLSIFLMVGKSVPGLKL